MPYGYQQPRGWRATCRRILERDEHTCYRCHGEATQVDHIVNVAAGGTHEDANLAAICPPCHTVKSEQERRAGYARRKPRSSTRRAAESHPNRA